MPAEEDMIGHGTSLSYYSNTSLWTGVAGPGTSPSGGSWVAIGSLMEVGLPTEEVDDVDTTHMGTVEKRRTFKGGLADPGTLDATLKYLDSQYDALRSLRGLTNAWKVNFNDGSGLGFNGHLKSLGGEVPIDNLITVPISVKVSGNTYDIDATA